MYKKTKEVRIKITYGSEHQKKVADQVLYGFVFAFIMQFKCMHKGNDVEIEHLS